LELADGVETSTKSPKSESPGSVLEWNGLKLLKDSLVSTSAIPVGLRGSAEVLRASWSSGSSG